MFFFPIVLAATNQPNDYWSRLNTSSEPADYEEMIAEPSESGPEPASGDHENDDSHLFNMWLYMIGGGVAICLSTLGCGYLFHRHFNDRNRKVHSLSEQFIPILE